MREGYHEELLSNRGESNDDDDNHYYYYYMLRTEVLQSIPKNKKQFITAQCKKYKLKHFSQKPEKAKNIH